MVNILFCMVFAFQYLGVDYSIIHFIQEEYALVFLPYTNEKQETFLEIENGIHLATFGIMSAIYRDIADTGI